MNISFPNPPADPNKPKKKNKGCLAGCLVVAVLFLVCAAVGFFVLQATIVNWFKKPENNLAGFVTQFTNLVEQASAEPQARALSNENARAVEKPAEEPGADGE